MSTFVIIAPDWSLGTQNQAGILICIGQNLALDKIEKASDRPFDGFDKLVAGRLRAISPGSKIID